MVENREDRQDPPRAALLVRNRGISLIWIIPLAAALAAGWLGWRSYANRGPLITITFNSAAGIEAGKTKIKYKDADLGIVRAMEPTADLSHVVVTVRMEKIAEPYLTKNARFWVAKPNLTSHDLSGLGTIISGPYIEFEPGRDKSAKASKHFVGEDSPSIIPSDEAGETYKLHTQQLGSIDQGTPVYFHGVRVGKVLGYELSDKDGSATVYVFIEAPHNDLVHEGTRFWNASGIAVNAGSGGLKIRMESIQSLITGGIAFDVPDGAKPGDIAKADADFALYPDESNAQDAIYSRRIHFLLHLAQPAAGLSVGSPVRLHGVPIGQVTSMNIAYDAGNNRLVMPVVIEVETERLALLHHAGPLSSDSEAYAIFHKLVASGLRARLASGNLLTGQKVIDLAVIPNTPAASMLKGGEYPEIPTVDGDDFDAIMRSAKDLLTSLQTTVSHLNQIVSSPELLDTVHSLNDTLKQVDQSLASDNGGGDLAGTLHELKDAARSVKVLTDYLDNHPEALLRGKAKE